IAADLVYNVSKGKMKTNKHITLGMTLKSLISSRKIVEIINRYGHCCSYHVVEELETEATFSSSTRSELCPDGIKKSSGLNTGVAFDNFDRFVDTASGKDTLHDTVGIIYQDI
ncbi:GSCOCG00012671001-RA-CDS, partial [Cotesia congregata]